MKKAAKIATGVAVGAVVLVGGAYVASYFIAGNQVPAKASVEGVSIGGLSPEQAREKLETELDASAKTALTLEAGGKKVELVPADSGLSVDYEATVRAAGGGFSWNPVDIVTTLTGGGDVDLVRNVDTATLTTTLEAAAPKLAVSAVDATVSLENGKISRTDGTQSQELKVSDTVTAVAQAFKEGKGTVQAATETKAPAVTTEMVDEAVESFAKPLLSAPIKLTLGAESMSIAPGSLAKVASFEVEGDKLVGSVDGAQLLKDTKEAQRALKLKSAQDASYKFTDGKVQVVPAVEGQTLDEEAFVAAVEKAATASGAARTAELKVAKQEPKFDTAAAKAVGDFKVIGEFTTQYPYAEYRNTNIGRAASVVNGTVLQPGETFSLNDTLGERTAANGYAPGYVINNGRLVMESGGGISQAATTLFNAAFFAGYKDVEHQPHTLYFDRYPAGREATVYYGQLDLKFQNDTKYPAIIQGVTNKATPGQRGSVTFRIWSKPTYEKVTSTELVKSDFYSGTTRTMSGANCEPQGAISGFSVNWQRQFWQGGKVVKSEPFHWKYSAGDRIVCE